jgi:tripeptidyl-peptidase-1
MADEGAGAPIDRAFSARADRLLQVEAFAAPSDATKQAVTDWLSANSVQATPLTPAGDWISIEVPVSKANQIFNADLTVYEHVDSGTQSVRTLEYSLPAGLSDHVLAVHPTTSCVIPASCRLRALNPLF